MQVHWWHHAVPEDSSRSQLLQVWTAVARRYKICHFISYISSYISRYIKIYQDISRYIKISEDAMDCFKMNLNPQGEIGRCPAFTRAPLASASSSCRSWSIGNQVAWDSMDGSYHYNFTFGFMVVIIKVVLSMVIDNINNNK